jgi:Tol biopolymer transport system component
MCGGIRYFIILLMFAIGILTLASLTPILAQETLSIVIIDPEDGWTYETPLNLDIIAEVSLDEEEVHKVEFFAGETLLGLGVLELDDTYSFIWQDVPVGVHVLTARVTDTLSLTADSPPVVITVTGSAVTITPITVTLPPYGPADGDGWGVAMSGNGRYVVFSTYATNLIDPEEDTNEVPDIYLVDRQTETIERVSIGLEDAEPDNDSWDAAISADGGLVAFASNASNLVEDDSNGQLDVFVYDRQWSTTERVSVDSSENEANGPSWGPSLSGTGTLVAFISDADNLVANDTNESPDIFLRNRQAGTTERVIALPGGTQNGGGTAISSDGRYVAFWTEVSLVQEDDNEKLDVYVYDRQAQTVGLVSVDSQGNPGDGDSWGVTISDDGRYVAFVSDAANLVANDVNDRCDVFVHDRQTGDTILASPSLGDADSWETAISGNGEFVVFSSDAANYVGDTNASCDVFRYALPSGPVERVSRASSGAQTDGDSWDFGVSDDGEDIAFVSLATNLAPGEETDGKHVHAATIDTP